MPIPKLLESIAGFFLPSASREHVLGDLRERNETLQSYLADFVSVLGPVIVSRIRRTTDMQVFLMEALIIYSSFTVAAWWLGLQSFLYIHAGFARLVVPTVVALVALLFCNAYSDSSRKSLRKPILQSAGSLSLALLGQAALFDTQPGLAVPFLVLLYGGAWAALLIASLRLLFPTAYGPRKFVPIAEPPAWPRSTFVAVDPIERLRVKVGEIQRVPKVNSLLSLLAVVFILLVALRVALRLLR